MDVNILEQINKHFWSSQSCQQTGQFKPFGDAHSRASRLGKRGRESFNIIRTGNSTNQFSDEAVKSIGKVHENNTKAQIVALSKPTKALEAHRTKLHLLSSETANLSCRFQGSNYFDHFLSQECMQPLVDRWEKHYSAEVGRSGLVILLGYYC